MTRAAAAQTTPREQPVNTFTSGEAVAHPVIRAAVIAGHEAARITGRTVAPATVLAMSDAGLHVVAALRPDYAQDPDAAALVERVLVGLLVGALTAGAGST